MTEKIGKLEEPGPMVTGLAAVMAQVKARHESILRERALTTGACDESQVIPEPDLDEEFDTAEKRAWPPGIESSDWAKVPPSVREALKHAVSHGLWPIYLTGPVGTGKSYAAAVLYKFWRRRAVWYSMPKIIADVMACRTNDKGFVVRRKGNRTWDEFEANIFGKITDASLVVFDDLGLREPSPAAFEVLYLMIEARRGKPTIFTSNLDARSLAKAFDERIASRLLCGARIAMRGKDQRFEQGVTLA